MLAERALVSTRTYFNNRNHHPSNAQWAALAHLAGTLEAMANGTAEAKFYLSSLDPGVGKSQTLIHFIEVLLASSAHEHVGALICVSRLSEIDRMVRDIKVPPASLCVRTSDTTLNTLGKAPADDARVVITTQQMIERRLAERTFTEAGLFTFQGKPRAVRVWDEAWLPGHPVTLNTDDMAFVLRHLSRLSPQLRADVRAIFDDVEKLDSGSIYAVPDFADKHAAISLNDALGRAEAGDYGELSRKLRDDERAVFTSLWYLSGKTVTVHRDGPLGKAVLDYRETLPPDLAPMVVLDASGRVRETYRDIEVGRGTLVRLPTAPKDYSPLTVHVWRTGGGKTAFAKSGATLAAGIAKTIDTRPTERWLVVCHRPDSRVGNVADAARELLTATPADNVSFITWGSHSATNEYAAVPNVILAGTLFYRGSHYEALKRLAAGRPASAGTVSATELRNTALGEHAHLILQALCRGAVRKCDDDRCHPANAFIIASARSGIAEALPDIFPGCRVVSWSPMPKALTGDAAETCEYVERWAKTAKPGDVLPFQLIRRDLGISADRFKGTVRRSAPLQFTLADLGLEAWGPGRYATGYRLAARAVQEAVEEMGDTT